jgi:hypothetical protein
MARCESAERETPLSYVDFYCRKLGLLCRVYAWVRHGATISPTSLEMAQM